MKRLCRQFKDTARTICADNFFTSVPLAKSLWSQMGLKYVGTVNKKRRQIPEEFLPKLSRPIESSLFGFDNVVSMVSYVPKKSKAVVLISTVHHDKSINVERNNKPEIILHYNKHKGGVDTLDFVVEKNTCRRKTNKWTRGVMMFILDNGGYDSFVLGMITD